MAEEKRELFRSQIRQKYGIKSKEEANSEKANNVISIQELYFIRYIGFFAKQRLILFQGPSKSFEGGFRAFISIDLFSSKEKPDRKKVS